MKTSCRVALLAVVAWSLPLHANDPFGLIGSDIPAPHSLAKSEGSTPDIPAETLDTILELPGRAGIEALIKARVVDLTRRGSKEIGINRRVAPSTAFIQQGDRTCTGTIVGSDGKILTCWHCVRGKGAVDVRLHPNIGRKTTVTARVVRADPAADLALLQLVEPVSGLHPLPLGKQEEIEVGADVYAVGHPSGLNWSFVKGLVSQVYEKRVWDFDHNRHEAEVVQAQIDLYPGNSGGPLISDQEHLVGVNASTREGEKFAFAIALSEVRRFLGKGGEARPETAVLAQVAQNTSCARKELARGRNADNTGTVMLFDTNCDSKVDVQLLVLDGAANSFAIATSSDGSGKVDMVRVHRGEVVSTYLSGTSKQRRQ